MRTKYLAVSVSLVLVFVVFLPQTEAVVPPPDGGYPGFTTAEGTNALKTLTTGVANTGTGWYSLFTNSSGSYNTGVGAGTLVFNDGEQNTATGVAALLSNTSGLGNTATGVAALLSNTTGDVNTATGIINADPDIGVVTGHWHQCAPEQHSRLFQHSHGFFCPRGQ